MFLISELIRIFALSNQIKGIMKKFIIILAMMLMCLTETSSAQEPGVYIMSLSGCFVNPDEWSEDEFGDANAVALVTDKMRALIALTDASKYDMEWGPSGLVGDVLYSENNYSNSVIGEEWKDCDGMLNTVALTENLPNEPGTALSAIEDFRFPDGTIAYMPAVGEFFEVSRHIDDVNKALVLAGGHPLVGYWYWTSTQHYLPYRVWAYGGVTDEGTRWFAQLRNGNNSIADKYGPSYCRLRLFGVMPEVQEINDDEFEEMEGIDDYEQRKDEDFIELPEYPSSNKKNINVNDI